MKKSLLPRSLFLPALAVTLASFATTSRAVVFFDGISDVTVFSVAPLSGDTFMGQGIALDAPGFSAALNQVSSFEVGLGNLSGANVTARPVRLNMWIYQSFDPAAVAPAQVFSNQIGTPGSPSLIFDFATLTLDTGFLTIATLTLGAPLSITPTSGSTIGMAFNWQVDQGAGFVSVPGFTTIIHGGGAQPPPTVGTNATGVSPNFGYYRNAAGETNGNFLGASLRQIGANSGLLLRINGPDPIPEPTTAVLGAVFGLTLLRRRRA